MLNRDEKISVKDVFLMPTDGLEPAKSTTGHSMVVVEGKDGRFYGYKGCVSNNALSSAVNFANRVLDSVEGISLKCWNRLDSNWVKASYPYCEMSQ
ncbi:hypothetical protein [Vibrio sp. D431a]|uniref:hypothetical protein n=1 Tax=Vibrio sp. D431a TaxID=2837388 RepID=UPI0025554935|nr:hypothetical protein [Vibrio sp. D431a]MDK9793319.1 hypothetical protein [Vibrio sp. D431a]